MKNLTKVAKIGLVNDLVELGNLTKNDKSKKKEELIKESEKTVKFWKKRFINYLKNQRSERLLLATVSSLKDSIAVQNFYIKL